MPFLFCNKELNNFHIKTVDHTSISSFLLSSTFAIPVVSVRHLFGNTFIIVTSHVIKQFLCGTQPGIGATPTQSFPL